MSVVTEGRTKKSQGRETLTHRTVFIAAGCWGREMRKVVFGVFGLVVVGTTPGFGQNILKAEPFVLAPYEVVLVEDGSCSAGKILKVTGAIRGLRRRKACIPAAGIQASLGVLQ
ncbi:hypothetical protein ONR75_17185 [Rhodopseudomonas sp. P2A-2r]|uniref:DUF6719 family protein n=1 Tax=Rhodopseudomonas sp. P2A-2r TaxID=2991972 RepID=UPI002233EBCC|nr:hypothetical protein ONR75_17185 [Rhodopseudomonas sp. P2A-2r]